MMEYKGYIATVEYDDSVGMLHGKVVNAGPYPIVTFEAVDVEGLNTRALRNIWLGAQKTALSLSVPSPAS